MAIPSEEIKLQDKPTQLVRLLNSPQTEFILEAHNGISATIVEKAGFRGIWASGLALSAQFGVRDNNEASWTQIVEMLEFMSDATTIPILLDGDTGYGNFNNMRRLVKKLEQRNIAGVCIEDKQFPKTNSFINSERQPLANIDEFCGKIKAGKDSQLHDNFCVIARVEALIAGWGLSEALRRAEAYHAAGADGILIHSKLSKPDEILAFAGEWAGRCPLVIVPTTYYSTPVEVFQKANISLVIWANHMLRASVASMEKISREIMQTNSVANIEDGIAPVNEIFSLQGVEELAVAEERYMKVEQPETRAIILAASRGEALQQLTRDKPKVMLSIGGKTLLRRLLDEFKKQSINKTILVAGYKSEVIDGSGIEIVINDAYETTNELSSLMQARESFSDDMIITYGDLLIRGYILRDLLETEGNIVVVVDSALDNEYISGSPDYAYCSKADDRSMFRQDIDLQYISDTQSTEHGTPSGRWIGMLHVKGEGLEWLLSAVEVMQKQEDFSGLTLPDLLNYLVNQGRPIKVQYIHGHWLDINSIEDLDRAGDFASF